MQWLARRGYAMIGQEGAMFWLARMLSLIGHMSPWGWRYVSSPWTKNNNWGQGMESRLGTSHMLKYLRNVSKKVPTGRGCLGHRRPADIPSSMNRKNLRGHRPPRIPWNLSCGRFWTRRAFCMNLSQTNYHQTKTRKNREWLAWKWDVVFVCQIGEQG